MRRLKPTSGLYKPVEEEEEEEEEEAAEEDIDIKSSETFYCSL
jgi:hypothetical protein